VARGKSWRFKVSQASFSVSTPISPEAAAFPGKTPLNPEKLAWIAEYRGVASLHRPIFAEPWRSLDIRAGFPRSGAISRDLRRVPRKSARLAGNCGDVNGAREIFPYLVAMSPDPPQYLQTRRDVSGTTAMEACDREN